MKDSPLPHELQRFSGLADLAFRGGGEWSASCPHCGGAGRGRDEPSDRFRLFARSGKDNARVWCRRCGYFEWADQNEKQDEAQLQRVNEERAKLAQREERRLRSKIEALQQAAYWRGWHDAMTDQQRAMWRAQGVIDFNIDYYKLGYCPDYVYNHAGDQYHSASMTIPHYGEGWQLVNIQHRLLAPVAGAGRYRQMSGLPASMFRTEPGEKLAGAVLVVEGAKKAIVTYTHLGLKPLGRQMLIVGVTSKAPSKEMLAELANCEPVYLALDPDAYLSNDRSAPAVNRVANRMGRERVRIVKLPCKPDDMLTMYGGTGEDLIAFLKVATAA